MTELQLIGGRVRISPTGRPEAGMDLGALVSVLLPDGSGHIVPITASDGTVLRGRANGFSAELRFAPAGRSARYQQADLTVRYEGGEPLEAGLRVETNVLDAPRPHWLVPGLFYGENRLPGNRVRYPRWDPAGGDPTDLVSHSWSFRADRSALPAVLCRAESATVCLWSPDVGELGQQGIGFRGDGERTAIWLDFPYREEPVAYVAADHAGPADICYHHWQPAEEVRLSFAAYAGPPDRHAYDALLREAYDRLRSDNSLHPWLQPAEAADLTAEGLLRWHYQPEQGVLYETASFDRSQAGAERGDRPHMHVGWVSGSPWAGALLDYGRRQDDAAAVEAGIAVLDTIASGLAPCGAFWGEWRAGSGWSGGWNPGGQLHARTLAEATLFMLRALAAEQALGQARPEWQTAVRSNLDFVRTRQRSDGNCGSYYEPQTGDVASWEGAAGLLWIAALAAGATLFEQPRLLRAAERAGDYYARFVEDELIYGAPEDVHLTPTSEDGYGAVIAYMSLHEATGDTRWLALGRRAAEWTMTFRYAYNVSFPPGTTLAEHDFRTRGGDQASPANQHLHAYGLICLPEMIRLWRATGDHYYLARTRDNLACFLQFVARHDGDFGARRGMVSERFHQTAWAAPKGAVLELSHAWSVGVVLYASLAAMEDAEAFPPGWFGEPAG